MPHLHNCHLLDQETRPVPHKICGVRFFSLVIVFAVISCILWDKNVPNARGSTCSTKGARLEAIGTASNRNGLTWSVCSYHTWWSSSHSGSFTSDFSLCGFSEIWSFPMFGISKPLFPNLRVWQETKITAWRAVPLLPAEPESWGDWCKLTFPVSPLGSSSEDVVH